MEYSVRYFADPLVGGRGQRSDLEWVQDFRKTESISLNLKLSTGCSVYLLQETFLTAPEELLFVFQKLVVL